MPLGAEDKRLSGTLDRLHDTIFGPGHNGQTLAELVDSLTVERVDFESLAAKDLGQLASSGYGDRVGGHAGETDTVPRG